MILAAHMAFGAATGYAVYQATGNVPLALVAALLSHYLLDLFPHIEYLDSVESSVGRLATGGLKKAAGDIAKVFIDFAAGLAIIFLASHNQPIVYGGAFFGIIPDGLTVVSRLFPNRLSSWHDAIHTRYIHYLTKQKKFSIGWRIATQAGAILVSILLLH